MSSIPGSLISCLPANYFGFPTIRFALKSNMQRFLKVFKQQTCKIIGMIHVDALPGERSYTKASETNKSDCY